MLNTDAKSTPWPICQSCRDIPLSIFSTANIPQIKEQQFYLLKPSFTTLCYSASRGCHVCSLLYEAVAEPFKRSLKNEPVFIISQRGPDIEKPLSVSLAVDLPRIRREENQGNGSLGSEIALAEQFTNLQVAGNSAANPTLHSIGNTTSTGSAIKSLTTISSVKFTLVHDEIPDQANNYKGLISLYKDDPGAAGYIRQSLKTCLEKHQYKGCEMVQYPHSSGTTQHSGSVEIVFGKHGLTTAPTRLVDVGSGGNNNSPPRLVTGKNCLQDGEGYLVLSYCNGTTPNNAPWRLTIANKEEFEVALPMHLLPQSLHDAIVWTRWLDHRYIWIDNLCIIQDSATDWQRESSRMATIYGSATMTLVTASGSIYGGMTDRRSPLKNCAAALNLRCGTEIPGPTQTVFILPAGQRGSKPLPAATESRAWCYQEDLLSPRLVRFSLASVEWQCCANSVTPERAKGVEQIDPDKPWRLYEIWYAMIERYTQKQLTYANDKMTAFSGIAANKAGSQYVAGQLKTDPWASLLWCRTNDRSVASGTRYGEYIAPSWSWASVDVAVQFPCARQRSRKPVSSFHNPVTRWDPILHDAVATTTTLNTLGPVGAGHIDITLYAATAVTTSDAADLLQNGPVAELELSSKYLSSPGVYPVVLGELVFDIASEIRDGIAVKCVLLHISSVKEWLETGHAGFGIAVVPDNAADNALSLSLATSQGGSGGGSNDSTSSSPAFKSPFKRIGYVKFTAAFVERAQRQRLKII